MLEDAELALKGDAKWNTQTFAHRTVPRGADTLAYCDYGFNSVGMVSIYRLDREQVLADCIHIKERERLQVSTEDGSLSYRCDCTCDPADTGYANTSVLAGSADLGGVRISRIPLGGLHWNAMVQNDCR